LDYLVPGLIREKITWYLKALPKQIRRILVPLPESVTGFLDLQTRAWQQIALQEALEKFIVQKTSLTVPAETWQITDMPSHLLMNIRVLDDTGQELAISRNLAELQTQLGKAAQMTFVKRDAGTDDIGIERDAITQWDFGDLPVEVPFNRNGQPLTGYPALIDKTDNAAIRLFDTKQAADSAMRLGVRRLLCLTLKDQLKQIEKNLPGLKQASVQLVTRINPGDLKQDMLDAIVDRALLHDDPLPRTAAEFAAHSQRAKSRLPEVTAVLARLLQQIGSEYQLVLGRLASTRNDRVKSELDEQLGELIYPGFLSKTAWQRLQQFPRYLKGMALRLEKLPANLERDERNSAEIAPFWKQCMQQQEKHRKTGLQDHRLDDFRWQIE
ncbi:MAG: DUF3418 domain-containing protein, partial [Nitrosomonadaceae bacterium]|nr:DUF3418 domain-containing protein [Nitrosomonadaceae bacterium]